MTGFDLGDNQVALAAKLRGITVRVVAAENMTAGTAAIVDSLAADRSRRRVWSRSGVRRWSGVGIRPVGQCIELVNTQADALMTGFDLGDNQVALTAKLRGITAGIVAAENMTAGTAVIVDSLAIDRSRGRIWSGSRVRRRSGVSIRPVGQCIELVNTQADALMTGFDLGDNQVALATKLRGKTVGVIAAENMTAGTIGIVDSLAADRSRVWSRSGVRRRSGNRVSVSPCCQSISLIGCQVQALMTCFELADNQVALAAKLRSIAIDIIVAQSVTTGAVVIIENLSVNGCWSRIWGWCRSRQIVGNRLNLFWRQDQHAHAAQVGINRLLNSCSTPVLNIVIV